MEHHVLHIQGTPKNLGTPTIIKKQGLLNNSELYKNMQRILDLLLSEVRVSVTTRERNRPDLQAKHGVHRAAAGTPARVAYEKDRQPNMPPTPDGKPYAKYAASRQPRVKKDGAEVSSAEAAKTIERQRGVKTSKPVSQAARSAMGGKTVDKVQATNIMNRRRADLMRRGASSKGSVMTSQAIKDHTIYEGMLGAIMRGVAKKATTGGLGKVAQGAAGFVRGVKKGFKGYSDDQKAQMNRAEDRADMEPFNRAKMIDQINQIARNRGQK